MFAYAFTALPLALAVGIALRHARQPLVAWCAISLLCGMVGRHPTYSDILLWLVSCACLIGVFLNRVLSPHVCTRKSRADVREVMKAYSVNGLPAGYRAIIAIQRLEIDTLQGVVCCGIGDLPGNEHGSI